MNCEIKRKTRNEGSKSGKMKTEMSILTPSTQVDLLLHPTIEVSMEKMEDRREILVLVFAFVF